jgi:farnesyl diphosphate synthase
MYASNCDSDEEHKYAEEILLKMGYLFQFQDDYLDCYGDPKVIGKIGTDVEEGKCCWPIITALRLGNEKQIAIIKNNYGLKDSDAVKRVKDVYNELNLKAVYAEEEELYYKDICKSIDDLKKKSKLNTSIFYEILSKIYHRNK